MRIAHISDIHVARPPSREERNPKRLLGYLNYRLFREKLYTENTARRGLRKMLKGLVDRYGPEVLQLEDKPRQLEAVLRFVRGKETGEEASNG